MPVYNFTAYCQASADNVEAAKRFLSDINAEMLEQAKGVTNESRLKMVSLFTDASAKILSGESNLMSVLAFLLNDNVFTPADADEVELSALAFSHARAHADSNRMFVLSNTVSALDPLHPLAVRMRQALQRYKQLLSYKSNRAAE